MGKKFKTYFSEFSIVSADSTTQLSSFDPSLSSFKLDNQPPMTNLIGETIEFKPEFVTIEGLAIDLTQVKLAIVNAPSGLILTESNTFTWLPSQEGLYHVTFTADYKNQTNQFTLNLYVYKESVISTTHISASTGNTITLSAPNTLYDGAQIVIPAGGFTTDTDVSVKLLAGPPQVGFEEIEPSGDPMILISPMAKGSEFKLIKPKKAPAGYESNDFLLVDWKNEIFHRTSNGNNSPSPNLNFGDIVDENWIKISEINSQAQITYTPGYSKKNLSVKDSYKFVYLLKKNQTADVNFINDRYLDIKKARDFGNNIGCSFTEDPQFPIVVVIGNFNSQTSNDTRAFVYKSVMYIDYSMDTTSLSFEDVVIHEFFHVIQGQLLGQNYSYLDSRWWFESTADDFSIEATGTNKIVVDYGECVQNNYLTGLGFSQVVINNFESNASDSCKKDTSYKLSFFIDYIRNVTKNNNIICSMFKNYKNELSSSLIIDVLKKNISIPFEDIYFNFGKQFNLFKEQNYLKNINTFAPTTRSFNSKPWDYPSTPENSYKNKVLHGISNYSFQVNPIDGGKVNWFIASSAAEVPWRAVLFDSNLNEVIPKNCTSSNCYIDNKTSKNNYPDLENNKLYYIIVANIDFPNGVILNQVQRDTEISFIFESSGINNHTCAIVNGGAKCWGKNNYGQIGNNTITDQLSPASVTGLSDGEGVQAIVTGVDHTCALANGGIKCWGRNNKGQLGNNTNTDSLVPVDVLGLEKDVTSISVGGDHSCAIMGGKIYCWGDNSQFQLGNATLTDPFSSKPLLVDTISSGARMVSAGGFHTCALVNSTPKCWGSNLQGQLGTGEKVAAKKSPTDLAYFAELGVRSISSGGQHTCAIVINGKLFCWGDNQRGQIGDNTLGTANPIIKYEIPFEVPLIQNQASSTEKISTAHEITTGASHTCALRNGEVYCWGAGTEGELGNGALKDEGKPVLVSSLGADVQTLSAVPKGVHTCVIITGAIKCWGQNSDGTSGTTQTKNSAIPIPVSGLAPVNPLKLGEINVNGLSRALQTMSLSGYSSCALINGVFQCWGNYTGTENASFKNFNLSDEGTALTQVSSFASRDMHYCFISKGTIYCWGQNYSGQSTGIMSGEQPYYIIKLPTLLSQPIQGIAQDITMGDWHSCALVEGKVKCWGVNYDDTITIRTPTSVEGLSDDVLSLGSGTALGCAVLSSGKIKCYYQNFRGELGNSSVTGYSSQTAVPVTGIEEGATKVSGGSSHTCAIVNDGLYCWGNNSYSELGYPTTDTFSRVPQKVPGLSQGITKIGLGYSHTCALHNGEIKCWGTTDACSVYSGKIKCWGKEANGGISTTVSHPTSIQGLPKGILDFAIGYHHACAFTGKDIYCWGLNGTAGGVTGVADLKYYSTAVKVNF